MPKGISQYWTEAQEAYWERCLGACNNSAERHLVTTIRDVLKYDQRTKEGKRAIAQARLRLVTASDDELEALAKLEARIAGQGDPQYASRALESYKQLRERLREKGIRKEEITR